MHRSIINNSASSTKVNYLQATNSESSSPTISQRQFDTNHDRFRASTPKPIMHLRMSAKMQDRSINKRPPTLSGRTPGVGDFSRRSTTAVNISQNHQHQYPPGGLITRETNSIGASSAGRLNTTTKPTATPRRIGTTTTGYNRPMTAVRAVGYSSQVGANALTSMSTASMVASNTAGASSSSPHQRGVTMDSAPTLLQKDELIDKNRLQKLRICQQLDEACIVNYSVGDASRALTLAKEAANKYRTVNRNQQDQEEAADSFNINLQFYVFFTLANLYAANGLHREALNTYQTIIKSRLNPHVHNLKMNMGNVYFAQGQYQMSLKMYRMALDQVPSAYRVLRLKLMHNIARVFVKMLQWEEAISSLEYIMGEQPCHRPGLQLILCLRNNIIIHPVTSSSSTDRIRVQAAFGSLLNVPPCPVTTLERYNLEATRDSDDDEIIINAAIQNDGLFMYELMLKEEADYCVMTATKLVASMIDHNIGSGYDWCIAMIKNSDYAYLSADIEINKSIMYLKQKQLSEAIDTLKAFEKNSEISVNAAINLSFIYFLQGDLENATRYAEWTLSSKLKRPDGYVNLGACLLAKSHFEDAILQFRNALVCDEHHFEAIYNLGVTLKRQGNYMEALQCFQRFTTSTTSLALMPEVLYQVANLLELCGDTEAALESYQQLLGVMPTDVNTLQKIGQLYDVEGDKQQAHHYYLEAFRYYSADLTVLNWLAEYYSQMQMMDKAIAYYEKARILRPNDPKWSMLVAECYRRSGNLHRALTMYNEVHQLHPDSVDCIKCLIRLCSDLGMHREMQDHVQQLRKLEKSREVRERVTSSRPNSLRNNGTTLLSGRGLSVGSRSGGGGGAGSSASSGLFSPTPSLMEKNGSSSPNGRISSQLMTNKSTTSAKSQQQHPSDFDDFGNDDFGDDLLPV